MRCTPFWIMLLYILTALSGTAQVEVSGIVYDAETHETLPFVHVVGKQAHIGTTTDIDGEFTFESDEPVTALTFTYVGYFPQTIQVNGNDRLKIYLSPKSQELNEVAIFPGENPAERIIENAIRKKRENNPELAVSFIYESYNKFAFKAYTDNMTAMPGMDTMVNKLKSHFKRHHLLLMESVSERRHVPPDRDEEQVIASRISGFQNPAFAILATELQSFSVYADRIEVAGQSYISPISNGAIRKYVFQLEDTLYQGSDTVFVMAFRPRKGKGKEGLQGVISINTENFAVQNVRAQPYEDLDESVSYQIEQNYEQVEGQWFPVQLHVNMYFNLDQTSEVTIHGEGRSYLRNIQINPELKARSFSHITLKYTPVKADEADTLLEYFRQAPLDSIDLNTYHYMDSLSKAEGLEKRFNALTSLIEGQIPLGYLQLDLYGILGYNSTEKFRLGLPLRTSEKVSKKFSVGGYVAYGFGDKRWKYGGDLNIKIKPERDLSLNLNYSNDMAESGGMELYSYREFRRQSYRMIYVGNLNYTEMYDAHVRFRALRWVTWKMGFRREFRKNTYDYSFLTTPADGITIFESEPTFSEAYSMMRFAFREKRAYANGKSIILKNKYPILRLYVGRGFKGFLDGEYEYMRYEASIHKSYRIGMYGRFAFDVRAGAIEEEVPASKLFTPHATYTNFGLELWNTFETMRANEFLSDRFVSGAVYHNFGSLFFRHPKFRPEFSLRANAGFGWLSDQASHQGISAQPFPKGYYEVGAGIENLISSSLSKLGFGVSFRLGPYQLPELKDNFAYRVILNLPLE